MAPRFDDLLSLRKRKRGSSKSATLLLSLGTSAAIGNLSKGVFERRTLTGSQAFSLFVCLDANKFVLLSFFYLAKTIYPRVSIKPLSNDARSPLPVDVCCSKTLLLKLPSSGAPAREARAAENHG